MSGDVLAPDRLADRALDERDAALPPLAQLRRATQGAAVEVEVGLDELRGEVRRVRPDDAGGQPGAPVLDRHLLQGRRQVLEEGGLPDAGLGDRLPRAAQVADERLPVEGRAQRLQLVQGEQVVGLLDVAGLGALPVALREPGLDGHHRRRRRGRIRAFDQLEDPGQEGDVLLADLGELLVVVVRLVGQAEAALHDVEQHAVGVLAVDVDVDGERAASADLLELAEEGGEVADVAQAVDGVEQRAQRLVPERLDGLVVHEGGVEAGDPHGVVAQPLLARDDPLGEPFDDRADLLLGCVREVHEGTPAPLVRRDLGRLQPPPVDVTEEVVLRADVGIHALAGVVERAHSGEPRVRTPFIARGRRPSRACVGPPCPAAHGRSRRGRTSPPPAARRRRTRSSGAGICHCSCM